MGTLPWEFIIFPKALDKLLISRYPNVCHQDMGV